MTERKVIIIQVGCEVVGVYGSKAKAAKDSIDYITKSGYTSNISYSNLVNRLKKGNHYIEFSYSDGLNEVGWVRLMVVAMR